MVKGRSNARTREQAENLCGAENGAFLKCNTWCILKSMQVYKRKKRTTGMAADAIAYVKRLTSVPERFVDELFQFYGESTTQNDHVILLDHVARWLGTQ